MCERKMVLAPEKVGNFNVIFILIVSCKSTKTYNMNNHLLCLIAVLHSRLMVVSLPGVKHLLFTKQAAVIKESFSEIDTSTWLIQHLNNSRDLLKFTSPRTSRLIVFNMYQTLANSFDGLFQGRIWFFVERH